MSEMTMVDRPRAASPARPEVVKGDKLLGPNALANVVVLALLSGILVGAWVLFGNGGWEYYGASIGVRGYHPAHRSLRPSGSIGILLGIVGTLFMISTLPYAARKRVKWLAKIGSMKGWLEFHVFCGLFGPILITLHTSFKFNGVISVAYWSMLLVVLSGFVGRYLFVRIPRTIHGAELTQGELQERIEEMKQHLLASGLPSSLVTQIEAADAASRTELAEASTFRAALATGIASRRRLRQLKRRIRLVGLSPSLTRQTLELIRERNVLLQRLAHLRRTRQLFQLWHVFHRPLVWVMFLIFFLHLGVAVYFGYAAFGDR